ncbi:MAG: hypothetical protein ABSF24_10255 [Candidatus Bathyarchaeia archaeon]
MDWSDFDENYTQLKNVLRDLIGNSENVDEHNIYEGYLGYRDEVKIIVERIEEETQVHMKMFREVSGMIEKEEEPNGLLDAFLNYHSLIRLDVKSFFIFTRIFIDTLARIVKLRFGEKGKNLPWRMRKLLKNEEFLALDPDFAEEFKSKMSWMTDFIETRDEIEHYLGNPRWYTVTGDGKFGFIIQGSSDRNTPFLGINKVDSIADFMEKILSNLSEVILFIRCRFPS